MKPDYNAGPFLEGNNYIKTPFYIIAGYFEPPCITVILNLKRLSPCPFYKAHFFELFHVYAEAFIQRLSFIAELFLNELAYVIDGPLAVYAQEDKAAHAFKPDVRHFRSFEELLCDLIREALVLHINGDFAFI